MSRVSLYVILNYRVSIPSLATADLKMQAYHYSSLDQDNNSNEVYMRKHVALPL